MNANKSISELILGITMSFKLPKYENEPNYKLNDHLSIAMDPEWNKN